MYFFVAGEGYGPNVMFSDGESIGHIASSKDVSFVIKKVASHKSYEKDVKNEI